MKNWFKSLISSYKINWSDSADFESDITTGKILKNTQQVQIIDNIKYKIVNLNIPLNAIYYGLSMVKSTYVPELGKWLKEYNEDRDKFMEEKAKRDKASGK
jgi:hypothetical protein